MGSTDRMLNSFRGMKFSLAMQFLRKHRRTLVVAIWLCWATNAINSARDNADRAANMYGEIEDIGTQTEDISDQLKTMNIKVDDLENSVSDLRYR